MRRLSPQQVVMLRRVDSALGQMLCTPYERGARQTARSLGRLGLVTTFHGTNDGLWMHLTPEGAVALASLPP